MIHTDITPLSAKRVFSHPRRVPGASHIQAKVFEKDLLFRSLLIDIQGEENFICSLTHPDFDPDNYRDKIVRLYV